ncbi:hypothetical protein LTR46_005269 [Exophiala xenobiotica]|nr:hypothetical protein LTR46_005269 [Exophiala xenobiotica]
MASNLNPPSHEASDLDNEESFRICKNRLEQPKTDNFIVSFDSNRAKCALDVDRDEALRWLQSENRNGSETLWLNFWASESQRPIIEAVAKKYDLSPRLAGLLCSVATRPKVEEEQSSRTSESSRSTGSGLKKSPRPRLSDVEKGFPATWAPEQPKQEDLGELAGMTFSSVVKSLWHFCSVDLGPRYIHIGFNGLYSLPEDNSMPRDEHNSTPNDKASSDTEGDSSSSKPAGQRIWSSLLICDDGTVISVFERPTRTEPAVHLATRRNVLNIFRHLSKQHSQEDGKGALMKVRVRWNDQSNNPTSGYDRKEASSLLFYYLFDDWVTAFKLIARVEHPYREKLETLRQCMFDSAEVKLVKQVHDVGRQLTVLKLMYKSYELIVSGLIHSQQTARDMRPALLPPSHDLDSRRFLDFITSQSSQYDELFMDDDSGSNVKLSSSAVVRFERLLARIRLYALTEIEECIKEKDSLVLMNFNLVALKESQAVEKLTRTTILLAKATILFLPVSLMTAYFSIQLPEIQKYSITTYWLCFLVVTIVSILFLVVFGAITHTLEGKTVYQSITGTFGTRIWNAGKRKRKSQ